MGADIRVYDISSGSCRVLYKGVEYGVWKDPYSWEINVVEPGGKYIGVSLARVASFDDHNLQQAFASEDFKNAFVSNMLFEDFKYLGCERVFARRGDELCTGEIYQKISNKQGVYYENGKYCYVRTNAEGHIVEALTFSSERDMESVLHNRHIFTPASDDAKKEKPVSKILSDPYHNSIDPKKLEEAGKKLNEAGKKVYDTGKKVAGKGLVAGAVVAGTVAATTLFMLDRIIKKK